MRSDIFRRQPEIAKIEPKLISDYQKYSLKKSNLTRKVLIVSTIAVVVLIGSIAGFYFTTGSGTQEGNSAMQQVVSEVGKHVLLPHDETPALATVVDPSKLKNDRFLSQAKAGDKILIYAKWGQAVIYRPSIDKVIDIGPVNVNTSSNNANSNGFTPLN